MPSARAYHSYSVQLTIYLICSKSSSLGDLLILLRVLMLQLIRLGGTDIYNIKYSSHYTLVVTVKSFSFNVKWPPYFRVIPPPQSRVCTQVVSDEVIVTFHLGDAMRSTSRSTF